MVYECDYDLLYMDSMLYTGSILLLLYTGIFWLEKLCKLNDHQVVDTNCSYLLDDRGTAYLLATDTAVTSMALCTKTTS